MDTLLTFVTLLLVLSVSSERLVEIVKGMIPFLNQKNENPDWERWRRISLQVMALVAGIVTALLAQSAIGEIVPQMGQSIYGVLALGLLASGGSGLWNSILTYLLQVKDIKKLDLEEAQKRAANAG